MKTDVGIIGAGIIGCAAAYYLSRKGFQVLVVEKGPGVGLEASGRNGGGVRQQGRKAILPLAMESVRLWSSLASELQSDLEYNRTGNLNVALDETTAAGFEREIAWEHQNGLQDVRLLTATECQALIPGLTRQVVAGKLCSSDGIANPMLVAPAFARAAMKAGVKFKFNTPAISLLTQGNTVRGIKTPIGEIEAGHVINAAGPWAARFTEQVGCLTPIYPGRSQIMITQRLPHPPIRLWLSIRGHGYIRPTASGNLVLGTAGAKNEAYSQHTILRTMQDQAVYWSGFLPWLQEISAIRSFSGITEYTPDGEPYIGAVRGAPGLWIAAGFHAEGFCPGPMVGKILAELIDGQESSLPLDHFRPDRFSESLKAGKTLPPFIYPLDKMFSAFNPNVNPPKY